MNVDEVNPEQMATNLKPNKIWIVVDFENSENSRSSSDSESEISSNEFNAQRLIECLSSVGGRASHFWFCQENNK